MTVQSEEKRYQELLGRAYKCLARNVEGKFALAELLTQMSEYATMKRISEDLSIRVAEIKEYIETLEFWGNDRGLGDRPKAPMAWNWYATIAGHPHGMDHSALVDKMDSLQLKQIAMTQGVNTLRQLASQANREAHPRPTPGESVIGRTPQERSRFDAHQFTRQTCGGQWSWLDGVIPGEIDDDDREKLSELHARLGQLLQVGARSRRKAA